ncbi:pheromone A receptor-domain-containing protein [Russula aff. rugulosa BPL654]|nr:pheromone A receptor-domain-containing protein [Russula aff. rugulosa BPL654]
MGVPPNELFSAFSFMGFAMCVTPFYWHLEAWNTGTCLFMFWTGLGCLIEFINSVVWNKNMILRARLYCEIATRILAAENVAIPAASLCINRRLYKIATMKSVTVTASEKRRGIMVDLLIGVGIPILQVIGEYIISYRSYNIFEDIGPVYDIASVYEAIPLFFLWPLVIGCVSFVYCSLTIYTLLKRERQFSQIMSSNRNLNRGRYYRLMALSFVEICCTIPLSSYLLYRFVKEDPVPWKSWSATHDGKHFNEVFQVPSSVWMAYPFFRFSLECRFFYVLCAFVFFAFFGFADEAREHYRLAFKSLASRAGFSMTSLTLHGSSSHGLPSLPYMRNRGEVSVSVVTTSGKRRDSILSFTDQLSIPSIALPGDLKIQEFSPTDSMATSSKDSLELEPQDALHQPVVTLPAIPAPSVPPHHTDLAEMTIRAYSSDAANAV